MKKEIIIAGLIDVKREQDQRVYSGGGLSPCLRAENSEVKILEVKIIGQMDNTLDNTFESANRVYDKNGLCPTIPTCGGGGIQPKILEENCIVAMRGRGEKNEQKLEANTSGTTNALTTVQKDNFVLEVKSVDNVNPSNRGQNGNVISYEGLARTITVKKGEDQKICQKKNCEEGYRIRKLTPRECWRLMGFSDEDFEKAASVNSNTQLYKEAGNSICKPVLMAIFRQMNIKGVEKWNKS